MIPVRPVAYLYPKLRKILDLDGTWQFQEDPIDIGRKEGWFQRDQQHLLAREIPVPSAWQAAHEDLVEYAGVAWYATEFVLDDGIQFSHVWIDFTAVDYRADVWVDGVHVGHHEGGYSRFAVDLTPVLYRGGEWDFGPHYLAVRVEDPKNHAAVPHGKQGGLWYQESSGIWGSVYVEYLRESVILNDVFVKTLDTSGRVQVEVQVKQLVDAIHAGRDQSYRLRVTATPLHKGKEKGESVTLVHDAECILTRRTKLKKYKYQGQFPSLVYWDLETPQLYLVEALLFRIPEDATEAGEIVDAVSFEYGFRTVTVQDATIHLNGTPVLVRGVLDQAYYPHTLYVPPSEDYIRKEIRLMQELGVNLNRKHIKVEDPRYLAWCDRLGLLYWEEMPNFLLPTREAFRVFRQELASMVLRDRNHPCVVVWGIFNEEWGVFGLNFHLWHRQLRENYDLVKRLDDTRLVVDNSGWGHVKTDINDYHLYYLPPLSTRAWKRQLEFLQAHPEVNFARARVDHPERLPQVVSEYGACGLPSLVAIKKAHAGQWPYWFEHDGQRSTFQGACYPAGIERRFKALPRYLAQDLESLAQRWQWHQFLCVKALNEEMRLHDIKGYVLTEFSDLEWEFNGLVDYYRNPKVFHDYFQKINADNVVILRPERRYYAPRERVEARVYLSLFKRLSQEFLHVKWLLAGPEVPEVTGTYRVPTSYFQPYRVDDLTFRVPPEMPEFARARLVVQVTTDDGELVAENYESLYFYPGSELGTRLTPYPTKPVALYDPDLHVQDHAALQRALGSPVESVTDLARLGPESAVLTTTWDRHVRAAFKQGHSILLAAEFLNAPGQRKYLVRRSGFLHLDAFEFFRPNLAKPRPLKDTPLHLKAIPVGEHWYGMMALPLVAPRLFRPLQRAGPLFHDLAPVWPDREVVLAKPAPPAKVHLWGGIVYGWINDLRGTILEYDRGKGNGRVVLTTLRVVSRVAHPVAQVLLRNIYGLL